MATHVAGRSTNLGGLLIAVDMERSEAVVEELRAAGYWQASIVGRSKARGEWVLEVIP